MSQDAKRYKKTLSLPETSFPMRASLVEREPERLARWEEGRLYQRVTEARKAAPGADHKTFILHDGPPFANGDVHMGTALNKVLKDLIIKSKTMAGYYAPYVPGWDCHGLPIEFRVVKESKGLSPVEIRKRSEAYARKYIDIQRNSFRRLGIFGDWEHPYLTLDPAYEADIIRTFAKLVDQGLVYQSRKPVLWSYGAQTALAEAEVEYKEKVDSAVFVQFPLENAEGDLAGAAMTIWTTTPWTLPANLGIAVHEQFKYVVGNFAHEDGRTAKLIVVDTLVEKFTEITGFALQGEPVVISKGKYLEGMTARHPFLDRSSKIITGLFVTDETGTGAVHIAPGHGADDYAAGMQNDLGLLSPVDDEGKFTSEVGLDELVGMHVFASNKRIIEILTEKGALLGAEKYTHDYPFCWRSKTPIIFRAVEQFFVRIDELRPKALSEIEKTTWIPHWAQKRIAGTVESRPDWCISRQRTWGVPLPVLFSPEGEAIIDGDLARKIADLVAEHGTNIWFDLDDSELAARLGLPDGTTRCRDTLDVWIDSGCSHVAVLDRHPELHAPADVYIEATDQHRGWFQSSLMLSIAARGSAPYKTVLTHGFVVDTSGKKVSKSDQLHHDESEEGAGADKGKKKKAKKEKPSTAEAYYSEYGADMVRLWVSSVDWQNEVPFGEELFKQTADTYRRIRNTLRILLGNISGFDPAKDSVAPADMGLVDRWILERLNGVINDCLSGYEKYEFRKVYNAINQFCAVDLSSLYVDITKDRMYCDAPDGQRRRSAQTSMSRVLDALVRLLAPVLAYTADEAWEFAGHSDSVHMEEFPQPDPDLAGNEASTIVEELLDLRGLIQQEIEKARQAKLFGSNLEAAVDLQVNEKSPAIPLLEDSEQLREFFILSDLSLSTVSGASIASVSKTGNAKCERCWRHLPSVGSHPDHESLCTRCHGVIAGMDLPPD